MKKMKKRIVAGVCLLSVLMAAGVAQAEETRATNPNALSLELFGRGLLYGISYDRVLNDDLAAGVSFGRVPLKHLDGSDADVSTSLIPVYLNYYFMKDGNSLFATAGASLVVDNDSAKGLKASYSGVEFNSSTPVLPTFGLGFESRGDSGFLFRVAGYGIIGKNIAPWFGFSMGYSF